MKSIIRILIIMALMPLLASSQVKHSNTSLSGYIPELKDSVVDVRFSFKRPRYDFQSRYPEYTIKLKNGRFNFPFRIDTITQVSINIQGKQMLDPVVYFNIEPGDSIHFYIPKFGAFLKIDSVEVFGKGSGKFAVLRAIWMKDMDIYKNEKWIMAKTVEESFRAAEKARFSADSILNSSRKLVSPQVWKIMRAQYMAYVYESILLYKLKTNRSDTAARLFKKNIIESDYLSYFREPESVYHIDYPRRSLNLLPLVDQALTDGGPLQDMNANPLKYYDITSNFYRDFPILKNFVVAENIVRNLTSEKLTAEKEMMINKFLSDKPGIEIQKQISAKLKMVKLNLSKGRPYFNFSLEGVDGKMVHLSDFKGKVVFIDFYFTGCIPCRQHAPNYQKIEESFKGQDVVFLSISISDKADWISGRGIYSSPTSIQLYTNGEKGNHELIKYSSVKAYPTLLILDRDGKIFESNVNFYNYDVITKSIQEALKESSKSK